MSRWFRLYADAMRNPKVARLSDKEFRLWIRLLSVASENDGALPPVEDLKHVLNMRLDHLSTGLDRLISGGLIDALESGYTPHSWNKFQYKSDTSTARVTKHRAKRNVTETPPETETEAETERTLSSESGARSLNVKADPFPRPDWADPQIWSDFLANRKRKRLVNTATAHKGFLEDIQRNADDAWPPGRLLEVATMKGHGAIYPSIKETNNVAAFPNRPPQQSGGRSVNAGHAFIADGGRF